jgi:hypothetical protein
VQVLRGIRRQRDGEADQPVGAELEADQQRRQRAGAASANCGSQVCSGTSGTLTPKPIRQSRKTSVLRLRGSGTGQQRQQVEGRHRLAGRKQHEGKQQRHAARQHDQEITRCRQRCRPPRPSGRAGSRAAPASVPRKRRRARYRGRRRPSVATEQQQQAVVQAWRIVHRFQLATSEPRKSSGVAGKKSTERPSTPTR